MRDIEVLIDKNSIEKKVIELGKIISNDYNGEDILILGVLNGSFIFLADLIRNISNSNVEIRFIRAKSYLGTQTTGEVNINSVDNTSFKDKNILIVEDIIDTGITLEKLRKKIHLENPKSVKIAAFLDKISRRTVDIKPDYCCFEIPDKFVVGYGLDYNENYRHLPFVGVLE